MNFRIELYKIFNVVATTGNISKAADKLELRAHELLLQLTKINLGISCVVKEFSENYLKYEKIRILEVAFSNQKYANF